MIQAEVVQINLPPTRGNIKLDVPLVQGRVMPLAEAAWQHVLSERQVIATGHLRQAGCLQFEAMDGHTGKTSWYNAHMYEDSKFAPWTCSSCGKKNWQQRVTCRDCGLTAGYAVTRCRAFCIYVASIRLKIPTCLHSPQFPVSAMID